VRNLILVITALTGFFSAACASAAQQSHDHTGHTMQMPMKHPDMAPPRSALEPAQGASVKIISPKDNQIVKGDKLVLHLKVVKGKRGEHVHAYVDGELVGMFKTETGTLNGIKPGRHTLEVRVATADHNIELDATDKVTFTVK
jgi:ASC-1-like (ASCH) protein